jgi:hypothetical protein
MPATTFLYGASKQRPRPQGVMRRTPMILSFPNFQTLP